MRVILIALLCLACLTGCPGEDAVAYDWEGDWTITFDTGAEGTCTLVYLAPDPDETYDDYSDFLTVTNFAAPFDEIGGLPLIYVDAYGDLLVGVITGVAWIDITLVADGPDSATGTWSISGESGVITATR